jgi:hypothetical protein
MDRPPLDADDWSDEQWRDWLNAPPDTVDDGPVFVRPRPRSAGSAVLAAGMLGLERALMGKSPKPEIVVEAAADGQDDGLVVLDFDDPASSTIAVRRPRD